MPRSKLFKLPAFQDPDVIARMKDTFANEYSLAKASKGEPIDLQRIQNEQIRLALEETCSLLQEQNYRSAQMYELLQRRTNALSPATGFTLESYNRQCMSGDFTINELIKFLIDQSMTSSSSAPRPVMSSHPIRLQAPFTGGAPSVLPECDALGIYVSPDGSQRAFICPSPALGASPRVRTEVDPVLPPKEAFVKPGIN